MFHSELPWLPPCMVSGPYNVYERLLVLGQFTVVTQDGCPGVVTLQNVSCVGHYLAVRGGRVHGDVRRDVCV